MQLQGDIKKGCTQLQKLEKEIIQSLQQREMSLHNKREYAVIDAPSILGLRPTGVELLPKALRTAGLLERLNAEYCGIVTPSSPYNYNRDGVTKLLNP